MTLEARPGYLRNAPPTSAEAVRSSFAPALAAPAADQFAPEPSTDGSVPSADPYCAPDGRYPLEAINPGIRLTTNVRTEIARLVVPNESNYTDLAVQWWVDYPYLYDVGGVLAELRIANGPPIAIPLPTYGPLRIPKCIKPGQTVVLYATIAAGINVSTAATGNALYVGGSLQVGYEDPQWFLRTADRARADASVRSVAVVVPPGGALTNPFAAPLFVASRVRVVWPLLGPAAAAGQIVVSTLSQLAAAQTPGIVIDQALGNLQVANAVEIPMADLRELVVGNPAPATPLVAPATLRVEWDVWRIR